MLSQKKHFLWKTEKKTDNFFRGLLVFISCQADPLHAKPIRCDSVCAGDKWGAVLMLPVSLCLENLEPVGSAIASQFVPLLSSLSYPPRFLNEKTSLFSSFSLFFCPHRPTESLHWLCHQRQAADEVHAREQAVLPVQDVEIRGFAPVRVRHHDSNRPQHGGADDEGQSLLQPPRPPPHPHPHPSTPPVKTKWFIGSAAQRCFPLPGSLFKYSEGLQK